jgi:serine-type D-Ala-D-Ala carboxypeptidase/endopeptidase (penicillin-binding protein 4)
MTANVDSRGRWLRRSTAGAVVLVLLAATASYLFDLGPRWFGFDYPSPITEPAKVAPPPGLTLPAARAALPVAQPPAAGDVDPAAVRRLLDGLVVRKVLGARVAVDVAQLPAGQQVYRHGPDLVMPASTMKLLTTTAALEALGPDHRFTTTVVSRAPARTITLVGGGDPLLARRPGDSSVSYPQRADLATLAGATAKALDAVGRSRVRVRYDTSLFTGPTVNPHWPASYVPDDVVSPISPLWVDEGRARVGYAQRSHDPAAVAGTVFAQQLARHGIKVDGPARAATAPSDANELASVRSAPLAQIVQHILEVSDNEGVEVLARHVAIQQGLPASFAGGARAVSDVLGTLGVPLSGDRIYDGSGLSRQDRLRPRTLLAVLETAAADNHPGLRAVVTDLPVAGFTGSLAHRFDTGNEAGLGTVRAKTGTLTGVQGLAGTLTTPDGTVMAFVAVADRVKAKNALSARAALDRIPAALAACTCGATP